MDGDAGTIHISGGRTKPLRCSILDRSRDCGVHEHAGRPLGAAHGAVGIAVIVLLLLWMAMRTFGLVNPTLLPSPGEVFTEGWKQAASGELWQNVFASTSRVIGGVLIGTSLALPVGFLLGRLPIARLIFEPMLNFFRALPPIALIPLVIIYFGIGEQAKLIVLSEAAFFPAVIVLYDGIRQLPPIYVQVARTLGATEREVFTRVILPLTLRIC